MVCAITANYCGGLEDKQGAVDSAEMYLCRHGYVVGAESLDWSCSDANGVSSCVDKATL